MFERKKIAVQKCVYTVPVESRPSQKNLVMWVRIEDLPDDLKLDPNARRADVTSKVAEAIARTLRVAPESFWKLNMGIQMTARDVEVKDGKLVVLDLYDPEDDGEIADGVINGGHTYQVIRKVRQEAAAAADDPSTHEEGRVRLKAINDGIVRVEVLTGIEKKELVDISRARNTGEPVKKYSLQNLKQLFDPIKKELGPKECERISFCENDLDFREGDGKTFQVLDLIRLMSLFNNKLYPYRQNKHPVLCYTSAGRLVDKWESEAESYTPLVPKLRDLMRLHDDVYLLVSSWQGSQKGRPRKEIKKKEEPLPFTGRVASFTVSTAFVYPLLAALRVLLGPAGEWRSDPFKFLRQHGERLLNTLVAFYDDQCAGKPHELGRSTESWKAVAADVQVLVLEEQLAALA